MTSSRASSSCTRQRIKFMSRLFYKLVIIKINEPEQECWWRCQRGLCVTCSHVRSFTRLSLSLSYSFIDMCGLECKINFHMSPANIVKMLNENSRKNAKNQILKRFLSLRERSRCASKRPLIGRWSTLNLFILYNASSPGLFFVQIMNALIKISRR